MDASLLNDFLIETAEALDKLDQYFLELEGDPANKELLNSIFRTIHTIKGTCGFLDLGKLESITHVGESLLDSLRSGKIALSGEIISGLFELIDAVRAIVACLQSDRNEGSPCYDGLAEKLRVLNLQRSESQPPQSEADLLEIEFQKIIAENAAKEAAKLDIGSADCAQKSRAEEADSLPAEGVGVQMQTEVTRRSSSVDASLRVDVHLIDSLMNLVSELVLSRNQILQVTKNMTESDLTRATQRLNQITSQIQEGVMKTRMQPIKNVWSKLPRVVRDLAKLCGKSVLLETVGEDTELDKTVIEAIKDPLTHILRNSIDHGIETSAIRIASGKPEAGTIRLEACHEGGFVVIQVSDDGAGLNTKRICTKAVERNLVSESQLQKMSEGEINRLVFAPGFSTAEKVTNISGRGVGMDVVRSNIEAIGGAIDISSSAGKGTVIKIRIPLTLAIIPALMVECCSQRFAIPQNALRELLRVTSKDFKKSIRYVGEKGFYDFRGKLLPLLSLRSTLELSPDELEMKEDVFYTIAVVFAEQGEFGLIIDSVHDNEEIVVKPLSRQLKNIEFFSGATIMGDGNIALILDANGLAKEINRSQSNSETRKTESPAAAKKIDVKEEYIVLSVGMNRRAALPLKSVSRLEEFDPSVLEKAGDEIVVQYRDTLLPLVDVSQPLGSAKEMEGKLSVVVVSSGKQMIGLVVDGFIDVVNETVELHNPNKRAGVLGSAVLQGKVTELIDVNAFF